MLKRSTSSKYSTQLNKWFNSKRKTRFLVSCLSLDRAPNIPFPCKTLISSSRVKRFCTKKYIFYSLRSFIILLHLWLWYIALSVITCLFSSRTFMHLYINNSIRQLYSEYAERWYSFFCVAFYSIVNRILVWLRNSPAPAYEYKLRYDVYVFVLHTFYSILKE